jgi:HD-like signal output (HDOD) protein
MSTTAVEIKIHERVERLEATPAIPAVFLPLLDLLNSPPERVKLDEVIKLVSYDNAIAAQCLRVAGSPLFGLAKSPDSIRGAVISLGLRRVETILMTCCLGRAFPVRKWALDPTVFWRHSLGCAMVCRKFSEKLKNSDHDKAYIAGLMHDIGFLVNCVAFPDEFSIAVELALKSGSSIAEAEITAMGFTHCETGRELAMKWHISPDILEVITHHHSVEKSATAPGLVALVHLSDLLCRMRGLGYGYYERQKVDLVGDPAWGILMEEHRELDGVDLARFTFELDETVGGIYELVSMICGTPVAATAGN